MGAWGTNTFDNDDACDWAYTLEESKDLRVVESALAEVLQTDDYLECDTGANGLAACEVIARLKGNWGVKNSYTETVDKWVLAHPQTPPANLVEGANAAIDRVLADDSELKEMWEGNGEWVDAVEDLRRRVNA